MCIIFVVTVYTLVVETSAGVFVQVHRARVPRLKNKNGRRLGGTTIPSNAQINSYYEKVTVESVGS